MVTSVYYRLVQVFVCKRGRHNVTVGVIAAQISSQHVLRWFERCVQACMYRPVQTCMFRWLLGPTTFTMIFYFRLSPLCIAAHLHISQFAVGVATRWKTRSSRRSVAPSDLLLIIVFLHFPKSSSEFAPGRLVNGSLCTRRNPMMKFGPVATGIFAAEYLAKIGRTLRAHLYFPGRRYGYDTLNIVVCV